MNGREVELYWRRIPSAVASQSVQRPPESGTDDLGWLEVSYLSDPPDNSDS